MTKYNQELINLAIEILAKRLTWNYSEGLWPKPSEKIREAARDGTSEGTLF